MEALKEKVYLVGDEEKTQKIYDHSTRSLSSMAFYKENLKQNLTLLGMKRVSLEESVF